MYIVFALTAFIFCMPMMCLNAIMKMLNTCFLFSLKETETEYHLCMFMKTSCIMRTDVSTIYIIAFIALIIICFIAVGRVYL